MRKLINKRKESEGMCFNFHNNYQIFRTAICKVQQKYANSKLEKTANLQYAAVRVYYNYY